ncbi:MAG: hypothetical protein ACJAVT_002659 [Yoonia sp.]|jgi:hypothetical protein
MKRLIALILLAGCSACVTPAPLPEDDTCDAANYATLVGQPATALERIFLLSKVRVIRPNQAVTMDFRKDRINFMITEDEAIAAITCG